MKKLEFSKSIQEFLDKEFPNADIDNMSSEELRNFIEFVTYKRQEYKCLEDGNKQLGNSAYGACANPSFYFYNVSLAADITGECRFLTKFMWDRGEKFFHEDIWTDEYKEIREKFDIDLDFSKQEWAKTRPISIYSDTDSVRGKSLLFTKQNDIENKISIEDLFNQSFKKFGLFTIDSCGRELVESDNEILNFTDGKLKYVPVKRIIRHKTTKPKFKITTDSGKSIIVTGDHSCIVFRNGKQIPIKAKDINPDTDKVLSIKYDSQF